MIFAKNKIYTWIAVFFVLLLFGVLGFKILGDYSWLDALYMTVITVSTVGFKEVHPSGDTVKIFTIILIIFGISVFGIVVSGFTEYLIDVTNYKKSYARKNKKMIKKLKNHIIIFGYGKIGKEVVETLSSYNLKLVVIEKREIYPGEKKKGVYFLKSEQDSNSEHILSNAGIQNAQYLITTLPNDAENLFLILSAKQFNSNIKVISRVSHAESESKLRFAGVDQTVMINQISGKYIANLLLFPGLINFLDTLSNDNNNTPFLKEITIGEPFSPDKTIIDLDIRNQTGCNVIAYITPKKDYVINPEASTILEPKSKIIVIGNNEQIKKANNFFIENKTKFVL